MASTNCGECGLPLRWEQIEDGRGLGERWLSICACGMPCVFFPGRPDYQPENPLGAALLATAAPTQPSPPWIRLFQLTSGYPWWLPWRHVARACARCGQRVTFAVWTRQAPDRHAYSALCLACGRATSEYVRTDVELREVPVSGNEWSPPAWPSPACAGPSSTIALGLTYDAEAVRVWLDDERAAPEGWVHVRTPEESIELLRTAEVEEISLDHDLGLDVGGRERTGYDVLLWLEREVAAGRARPPAVISVHSGNVGAVNRMEQALESIRRLSGGG
jgi:hypothetical protein